ncbi:hypothetical protein P154DRAFT_525990 [Amniculicola lignicola CBS 123094]|uniref:F-box domain-containing protein n=1 Tax=Amniculicola lignicola CBS 123094 TaxID=1392246 RepID=A0A6A5W2C4_9PLEO|nr:hypothetical protein P154DRAFT_525990 [Amniculicola lignicola CBS 123094]
MESAKPYAPVLPAELMIQIFLDPVLDLYDVLRCAGVNRFWYQIAYQQNPVRRKLFLPLLDKSRNGIPTLRLAKGEPPNTIRRHARAYPQATLVVGPNPDTPQSAPWYLFLHPVIGQNRYSTRPDRSTEPPYFIGYQYENRAPIYAKLCRYHPPSSSSGPGQESWRKMCVTWPPVNKVKVKVDHGHLMY